MILDLAVIGQGAVSPAGIGIVALRKGAPVATAATEIRRPNESWPVLRVDLNATELQRWQREPRLRRSSPLTLFLIEAAEQALAGISAADRAQTGLIIAFSAGCLVYSRRFFAGMINDGRNRASPALFPETVFNSPGSHVASTLKLNGAVYALVGDEAALVSAFRTADIWLRQDRVKQVLVLGAEEFDPLALDAYRSARWLRRGEPHANILPSEGAGGVLVRRAQKEDRLIISAAADGLIYRTHREASQAARNLFARLDRNQPVVATARHTWLQALETKMLEDRPALEDDLRPYLGQAFTASAAWNLLRALDRLSPAHPRLGLPLWGLNHQLGLLELGSGA